MERAGLLQAVITQNVDMLHRRAGTRELVEVHGSIATCSCSACGERAELGVVRERLRESADGVPGCEACGAPMRPDVVLFGEVLPREALERAHELCLGAGLLLCIGSSLEVHPVASLPVGRPTAPGARWRSSRRAPRRWTRSPRCVSKATSRPCSRRSPTSSGCRLS